MIKDSCLQKDIIPDDLESCSDSDGSSDILVIYESETDSSDMFSNSQSS